MSNTRKRFRSRKAKPGQLIAYYGITGTEGRHEPPDVCAYNGEGIRNGDAKLLLMALCDAPKMYAGITPDQPNRWPGIGFLKELERRGYDITTLKFSIEKKREEGSNREK